MSSGAGVIERLRRPEYTGENRCVPCTVTNLLIAAALAVAVWFLLPAGIGSAAGSAVFVAAGVAVYLRGYLVPGTPWFTRTYFPDWLLRAFDKRPAAVPRGTAVEAVDVESALHDVGAVTECDDADDLCLTPEFREAWRDGIESVRREDPHPRELVAALGEGVTVEERGETLAARGGGRVVGQWPSAAALLADAAAAALVAERDPAWADLDPGVRAAVLAGVRLFVERCPSCDGPATLGEEVVQSCCRSVDVVAVTCEDCGARLFETEAPGAG